MQGKVKHRSPLLKLLVMAFGGQFAAATMASASLLSYDGFNYSPGSIVGDNAGSGWSTPWSTPSGTGTVFSPTLTDPTNTLATSPNRVQANGGDIGRNTAATFGADGTTLWVSFLMQSPATSGIYGGLNLGDLFIGDLSGVYGMNTNGGTGNAPTSFLPVANQTAFFVVRIDFASGNDTASLYMNPTPGGLVPVTPDAIKSDHDLGSFSHVFFETNANYQFDELRFGTTFADVTPIPEPSSLALLSLGTLGLLRIARRRKA